MTLPLLSLLFLFFSALNPTESCFYPREFDGCGCFRPLDARRDNIEYYAPGSTVNMTDGVFHPADYYHGEVVDGKLECIIFAYGCHQYVRDTIINVDASRYPGSVGMSMYWLGYYYQKNVCNQTDHEWYIDGSPHPWDQRRVGCFHPNNHTVA